MSTPAGGWTYTSICIKCRTLFSNPNGNLKYCNNCSPTQINKTICPSCNGSKLSFQLICVSCQKFNMTQCKYCQKWTKFHITMIDACQNCILQWQKDSQAFNAFKGIGTVNLSTSQVINPQAFWPNTQSSIHPLDSIFEQEANTIVISRDEIYKTFHESAEDILKYDWVLSAKTALAPLIDMCILAIINRVLEKLNFETIDTKFFKEM